MNSAAGDKAFTGSIPKIYETYLVPLIFEPYADDLARRLSSRPVRRVLEIAAGTGAVTRRLATALPESTSIVASDLNPAMLDHAAGQWTGRPIEWRQADALQLPFEDGSFDGVVCQFGVMFFPDKPAAFREARRVLGPGGVFLFNVWDRIETNEFADDVTAAMQVEFPHDPPGFLPRTPYAYSDHARIKADLNAAGLTPAAIETVTARSRAGSPRDPAIGFCQGTPLRAEIEARDPAALNKATDAAAERIAARFGRGAVDGQIQALVVTVDV